MTRLENCKQKPRGELAANLPHYPQSHIGSIVPNIKLQLDSKQDLVGETFQATPVRSHRHIPPGPG